MFFGKELDRLITEGIVRDVKLNNFIQSKMFDGGNVDYLIVEEDEGNDIVPRKLTETE